MLFNDKSTGILLGRALFLTFVGASGIACSGQASTDVGGTSAAVQNITIDIRRSLVVTEQPILARFGFERVLNQLVAQSGVPGLTAAALFHQWWDTQNPGPGLGQGPHCDDTVDPLAGPVLNAFPYPCRPAPSEGDQASCDPFTDPASPCGYVPIGLFNRFDLAPEDGSNCGEYRIVYGKRSGMTTSTDRNLLIFEAAMMNPHPQQGIQGCKQIVDVWGDLTGQSDMTARANALEDFYFNGQGIVPPVVGVTNYGDNGQGIGQIRANQFVHATSGWSLREYKLMRTCSGGSCTALRLVPVTDKNNPFGRQFDAALSYPAFQGFFPSQTASLAAATLPGIDIDVLDVFNTGHSQMSGAGAVDQNYTAQFGTAPSAFRTAIQTELTNLGSTLTPDDIVKRAHAMSCGGCHRKSNNVALGGGLVWPQSLGFTHVTENATEIVGGVTRFLISDALLNAFLPHRKEVLEDYLNGKPRPSKGPKVPIGGSHSHG